MKNIRITIYIIIIFYDKKNIIDTIFF